MKLGTHQISSKKILLLTAAGLIGALAGAGGTYAVLKNGTPSGQPAVSESARQAEINRRQTQLEESVPAGTFSPTTIAAKPDEYKGKELKVRGRVIQTGANKYIIAGQEKENSAAIDLSLSDFNDDINQHISGYVNKEDFKPRNGDPTAGQAGSVTITGIFTSDAQGLRLAVKKINS